jgi:hypothetical protein
MDRFERWHHVTSGERQNYCQTLSHGVAMVIKAVKTQPSPLLPSEATDEVISLTIGSMYKYCYNAVVDLPIKKEGDTAMFQSLWHQDVRW